MSFKDLENIKSSYNSVRMDEDLVNDFYIPVLSHAKKFQDILLQQVWLLLLVGSPNS